MLTIKRLHHRIFTFLLLLLVGSLANESWAQTDVTYHILALPMDHTKGTKNTKAEVDGYRVEAVKVIAPSSTIVLPPHFKSPLAKNFTYYAADFVTKGSVVAIYPNQSGAKYQLYTAPIAPYIKVTKSGGSVTEEASTAAAWTAHSDGSQNTAISATDYSTQKGALADGTHYFKMTTLNEGAPIGTHTEIYVTYEYDPDNTIAKLDGSVAYNISMYSGTDPSKKGFLALNRGRNNRLTIVPASKVSSSDLISDDFVKIDVSDTDMKTYWQSGDNWNDKNVVASNFHFLFRYIGEDPYNITICTDYHLDTYYIEKFANDIGQVNKYYKGSTIYFAPKQNNAELFITSDVDVKYKTVSTDKKNPVSGVTWDDKPGWYRQLAAPIWNSFAILDVKYIDPSKTGHVFLATRTHNADGTFNDPTKSGSNYQYNYIQAERNAMKIVAQTPNTAVSKYAVDDEIYELEDVNFKVKTQFGNEITAAVQLSKYSIEHEEISIEDIPAELDRKYINYTGIFYKDAALTQAITSFMDAYDEGTDKYNVYVGYEVSNTIPFKAIKPADSYTTATWYELTDFESDQSSGKKLKWDGSSAFKNNGGAAVYDKLSEFAFVGDPYELRILYRDATKTTKENRYVGAASVSDGITLGFNATATDGYKWEIPFGENTNRFVLRLFGSSVSTPMYWKWNATSAGNDVTLDDNAEPTRIKVLELPTFTYTYNMVDVTDNIAIKGTVEQPIFTPLTGYTNIPADIRSPFLSDETVTFWSTFSEGTCSNETDETPYTAADIYVKYTTSHLATKSIKLNNEQQFNVKLNEEYIYYDATSNKILSRSTIDVESANSYLWRLEGGDPYAMKIYNVGKGQYVTGAWTDNTSLNFVATIGEASRFIAMMSNNIGVYEVLAATGTTDYFHIGRPTAIGAETKIYGTATYAHEADELRFELSGKDPIKYTLIDKAGDELLNVSSNNPRLTLPAEFVSPLVETYYYYPTKALAVDDVETGTHTGHITEITDDTDEDNHVWVTYTVNNRVKFNDESSPYMLKFYNGSSYRMEDGNDKLTSKSIKAVYPYTNGDGNLNIYGSDKNEEQMRGGSSTRSRWIWFFDSDHDDPYHVRIHSKNTIDYNGVSHPTYLQTYAVHFNQSDEDVETVVTGGALPGVASTRPTEYMILGTAGRFKLLTTYEVPVDLDGDGNTTGAGENVRQYVNSFEQYWKTYNMIKLYVLEINKNTDAFSNEESTWVVPKTDNPLTPDVDESTYRTILADMDWHSYDAIANAVRWNGYNDKSDGGHGKKIVERLEHWYQTFNMGDGTFDIESADIPPVLILLDRHGWEIMRKPLPKYESYPYGDELAALKVYDSPLVEEYKFYSNATKATGCHKYTLRMQSGAERDQIKVNGEHYTSTSLAKLPPRTASGVISGEAISDLYVTYTVKEEYEKSYTYNFTDNGNGTYSESGTPSKFMILQNGRFARDNGGDPSYLSKPIGEASNPVGGNIFEAILSPSQTTESDVSTNVDTNGDGVIDYINMWYIQPNLNIDKEMGIKWGTSDDVTGAEPLSEYGTKKKYKDITGFDPYNIQLQNVHNRKFMTSHMTTTALSEGTMVGDYTGIGDSKNITLADWVDVKDADTETQKKVGDVIVDEGYDHTNLQVTNQTFMAVSDALGNMQLMPRFDHTQRINVSAGRGSRTTLADAADHTQEASADDNESMGAQTTFFVRPQLFIYQIIDNDGLEALRYKTAGEYFPSIPEHFKSPLAKEFTYYTGFAESTTSNSDEDVWNAATGIFKRSVTNADMLPNLVTLLPEKGTYIYRIGSRGSYTYKSVEVTEGLLDKQITGSFAEAGHNDDICYVKVRYNYDEDADHGGDGVLEGKWFTVKLANKDLQSSETRVVVTENETQGTGVDLKEGTSKPATIDEDDLRWQWKFLVAPADPSSDYYIAPDPYAVQIFNRYANYTDNPTVEPSPMAVGIKVPNANDGTDRFALLSHTDGGYALAVAGLGTASDYDYTYKFLNGESMTTSVGATTATEKNYQLVVATDAAYATAKADLEGKQDGDYYFKINNNKTYKKVTVSGGSPDEGANSTKEAWERAYHFTIKSGSLSSGSQLRVIDDVKHNFIYKVINNSLKLAVSGTQTDGEAEEHQYAPYVPETLQTPLLNMEDYKYYGFATPNNNDTPENPSDDTYTVIPQTLLYTINGLYDDVVWVRYGAYDVDKTSYMVPNKRNNTGTGTIVVDDDAKFTALNISGKLPYNIIWEDDKMMATDGTNISSEGSKKLSGETNHVWRFFGDDPYAIQIRHGREGKYDVGSSTLSPTADKTFMLLKKDGYEFGVLQETSGTKKLSSYGEQLVSDNPKYFIIFGLSTHKLIYRLVIANTCADKANPEAGEYVDIPYSEENNPIDQNYITGTYKLRIYGTTQRDLTNINYQLGETIWGQNYCVDAGEVSIGDVLKVPNEFYRPNCNFFYYIDNIQTGGSTDYQKEADDIDAMETAVSSLSTDGNYYFKVGTTEPYIYKRVTVVGSDKATVDCTDDDWNNIWQDNATLNGKYQGLKVTKLIEDPDLIGSAVKVNVAYAFETGLETNAGEGFVTSLDENLWYTFEAQEGAIPYLAHYTNAWGLQAMAGRDTRYTNDYLWTPLGDVYGFKMYNRYMLKNSGGVNNVMTMSDIKEGQHLLLAEPGTGSYTLGNEVFELLGSNTPGYFRIHPVINYTGTQYYVKRHDVDTDVDEDGKSDLNYAVLSTNYTEWTFALTSDLLAPYVERVGYVGGLTEKAYMDNKEVLDRVKNGTASYADMRNVQGIVYNDNNIQHYAPGYYRLHNQPGVSDISPIRYASGYLHDIEKTAVSGGVPMHFYSKAGVNTAFAGEGGLGSGFTVTNATRGDIPVLATEYDPSTIFYFSGNTILEGNPRSTMQTQGLYVAANPNGDAAAGTTTSKLQRAVMSENPSDAITVSLMDIGGAVLLIHDGGEPAARVYLNYDQSLKVDETKMIYDLKYYHDSPTDDAKWCLQPVQKSNTAGANEMPLTIATNNGGDNYYYTTFYAPYDVLLPEDVTGKTYNAYICKEWNNAGVHPAKVPKKNINEDTYTEGKFVPAGTPVIIRTSDETGNVKLSLPTTEPNTSISSEFIGTFLEKKLSVDVSHDVYTLGLPFTTPVNINRTNGEITAELPEKANSGVGFYINATPNKEVDALQSMWLRNNLYVLHNKIYYREESSPSRELSMRGIEFVPVIFDYDEEGGEQPNEEVQSSSEGATFQGDGCIYDMMGRKVATRQQVEDGSWRLLRPGIYILNGKKFRH